MPAIARSEPFREQACPLGVCDGSGWILGPEDVARPCECRAARMNRGRSPRHRLGDPRPLPRRLLRRPPVSDMARDLTARLRVEAARTTSRTSTRTSTEGEGLWFMGGTGTGKTTLGMLIACRSSEGGEVGRHLLHPEAADSDPPDLPGSRAGERLLPLLRARHLGRPPIHRRPRLRAAHRLGRRAALRGHQRALREPAADAGHQQRQGGDIDGGQQQ